MTLNSYVGCAHRCVYCYASYEWTPEFYDKVIVRTNSSMLLKRELENWKEQAIHPVFLSSATDCYQPMEGVYQLTRRCIETLQEHNVPYYVFTKSSSVIRDLDLHARYAHNCFIVWSITTLNEDLKKKLEPGASTAKGMLMALERMSARNIVTGVNIDPVIPGLTDDEQDLAKLVREVASRGGRFVNAAFLRLRADVWVRIQGLLREMGRQNLLRSCRELYFARPIRSNGYFLPDREYAERVLAVVRQAADKERITFGLPFEETALSQCSVSILRSKQLWEQPSLTVF